MLVFLFVDILTHATEPLEAAISGRDWGQLSMLGAALIIGFGVA